MKKTYQKPSIKVIEIESEDLLAASPSIGGNTGIGIGEGEPPTTGSAKSFFDFTLYPGSQPSSSTGIDWDD